MILLDLFLMLRGAVIVKPHVDLRNSIMLIYLQGLRFFIFGRDRFLFILTLIYRWFILVKKQLLGNRIRLSDATFSFKPYRQISLLSHHFGPVDFLIYCLERVYGTHRKWYMGLRRLLSTDLYVRQNLDRVEILLHLMWINFKSLLMRLEEFLNCVCSKISTLTQLSRVKLRFRIVIRWPWVHLKFIKTLH